MEGKISGVTYIRVRYAETDKMGIVYYGNYLTYFEVARTEFVRSLGKAYSSFEARGFILPVLEAYVRYLGSARYDDLLTVKTTLKKFSRVRLDFEYEITRDEGKIIAAGYTRHCWADIEGKPQRISDEIWGFFQSLQRRFSEAQS